MQKNIFKKKMILNPKNYKLKLPFEFSLNFMKCVVLNA